MSRLRFVSTSDPRIDEIAFPNRLRREALDGGVGGLRIDACIGPALG